MTLHIVKPPPHPPASPLTEPVVPPLLSLTHAVTVPLPESPPYPVVPPFPSVELNLSHLRKKLHRLQSWARMIRCHHRLHQWTNTNLVAALNLHHYDLFT